MQRDQEEEGECQKDREGSRGRSRNGEDATIGIGRECGREGENENNNINNFRIFTAFPRREGR